MRAESETQVAGSGRAAQDKRGEGNPLYPPLTQHPASPLPQIWSQYWKVVSSVGHRVVSLCEPPMAPSSALSPSLSLRSGLAEASLSRLLFTDTEINTLLGQYWSKRNILRHLGSRASCSRDPTTALCANTNQAHRCCKGTWWPLCGTQLPRALSHQ